MIVPPPQFSIVVAADAQRGIGRAGDLPWPRLPADLAHFRDITHQVRSPGARNAVIMGRLTWESIPPRYRPLSKRLNVVVSRQPAAFAAPTLAARSLDQALTIATAAGVESLFVVGGGQLYALAARDPRCAVIWYTRIDATFDSDTHFPPFEHDFEQRTPSVAHHDGGVAYRIECWQRRATA